MVGATAPSPPRVGDTTSSFEPSAPAADVPGCVGHYALRHVLGHGGSGTVWEAWDTRLKRAVAIKALAGPEPGAEARGLHEARVTARMRHPAFVAVHEVMHETRGGIGQTFLAMELVEGRTLAAVVAGGPVDEVRVRDWLRQAAEALAEAHAQGVAHGDIKPSNLMIEPSGRLRILDLGIAACQDPTSTLAAADAGPAGGTLAYMAPERLLGAAPDAASDAYSLGLTMHEMLTGRRAADGVAGLSLAHRRLSEDLPLPRGPGPDGPLFLLLDAMTRRDPAVRLGDLAQVVKRLATGSLVDVDRPGEAAPTTGSDDSAASAAAALAAIAAAQQLPASPQAASPPPASTRPAPPSPASAAGTSPAPVAPRRARGRLAAAAIAGLVAVALGATAIVLQVRHAPSSRDLRDAEQALHAPDDAARIDAAIGTFESALARDPAQARAAAALAIAYCLRHAGNERDATWLARADASAQVALRLDDGLALAHAAQAWVLELRGELESARAAYERALAIDPTDFHALNGLAQLLMRERRDDDALAVLDRALKAWPDEPTFIEALGTARFRRGELAQAETAFRRATQVQPGSVVAWADLNAVLVRQGRLEDALAALRQGLALRPDARLYENLGTNLFALGRYVESAEAFEQGVSAEKGSPNDYRNWANLADALRMIPGRQAEARRAGGHALDLLKPELAARPDATALSRAGLYAARLGAGPESTAWIEAALAQAPDDADVLFRATLAAEVSGDRTRALALARAALAAGLPAHLLDEEPELQALRRDRRFHDLMSNPANPPQLTTPKTPSNQERTP